MRGDTCQEGQGAQAAATYRGENWLDKTPDERHVAMTWMQRLKRVFNIDIETCERCAGQVKIIACIEDPAVIEKILAHLNEKSALRRDGSASRGPCATAAGSSLRLN